jgi:MFS family permease
VLFLAFLTAFDLHLLMFSYSSLIPLVAGEMGLSFAEAGLIFSASMLAILLFRIPWGFLSDFLGFLTTMRVAMIVIGVFSLLRGFAQDYISLLVFQLLLGVGFASIMPCLGKVVNVMFQGREGVATGIYFSGFPVGELVGLALTPYLLQAFGGDWRLVLKVYGVVTLALTILWWLVAVEEQDWVRA